MGIPSHPKIPKSHPIPKSLGLSRPNGQPIYDIFGFYAQVLQGGDLLAQATNARIYMPDFSNARSQIVRECRLIRRRR
ncbi:uncharacterized protein BDW43DRAFT_257503 [Aspergillus alliaceus]|uniref:uncharacterized protein n=1 Tax=Petromyces alliaceus TaxID=209559 RepID=UPI0012A4A825|nr:uncharacterized protein BDW43DRAFT_257503 [Aspergillus alliaceus]KAB8239288.1 hypothetical protein BDW43DRAFT_257503 [Aspergillus alliaceus]